MATLVKTIFQIANSNLYISPHLSSVLREFNAYTHPTIYKDVRTSTCTYFVRRKQGDRYHLFTMT